MLCMRGLKAGYFAINTLLIQHGDKIYYKRIFFGYTDKMQLPVFFVLR